MGEDSAGESRRREELNGSLVRRSMLSLRKGQAETPTNEKGEKEAYFRAPTAARMVVDCRRGGGRGGILTYH